MKNLADEVRLRQIRYLRSLKSIEKGWRVWRPLIMETIGESPSNHSILDLADLLSDIFKATGAPGREQASLSNSGSGWEFLVLWYLNSVLWGSNFVAINQKRYACPANIAEALSIHLFDTKVSAGTQILIFNLPSALKDIDEYFAFSSSYFPEVSMLLLESKTNWNDNAQIPMLWDIAYRTGAGPDSGVVLGSEHVSARDFASLRYGFVTVPSNKTEYKATSAPVTRLKALEGGVYWGHPSKIAVAKSIKELPISLLQRSSTDFPEKAFLTDLNQVSDGVKIMLSI